MATVITSCSVNNFVISKGSCKSVYVIGRKDVTFFSNALLVSVMV